MFEHSNIRNKVQIFKGQMPKTELKFVSKIWSFENSYLFPAAFAGSRPKAGEFRTSRFEFRLMLFFQQIIIRFFFDVDKFVGNLF